MKIVNLKKGFSLVELLVVIAIVTLLTTVFLGNRNQYTERLALKNETYKLALYIRRAQVYSLAVKRSVSPNTFDTSYGIYFHVDEINQFRFFTDKNGDGKFFSESSEIVPISNGIAIDRVCGNNGSTCFGPPGSFRRISITFKRPSASARIRFLNPAFGGGNDVGGTPPIEPPAVIYLVSQTNPSLTSSVKIEETGAISIQGL